MQIDRKCGCNEFYFYQTTDLMVCYQTRINVYCLKLFDPQINIKINPFSFLLLSPLKPSMLSCNLAIMNYFKNAQGYTEFQFVIKTSLTISMISVAITSKYISIENN